MKTYFGIVISMAFLLSCQKEKIQIEKQQEDHKTIVKTIYPLTDSIPVNVLKFYIQFSEPMREGNFLKHVYLYDDEGNDLKGVFFDNVYELWSKDHKTITLLVDPGRVKTGLQAHEKMGRAFEEGKHYTLKIDTTWKSITGNFLIQPYEKRFVAITEDIIPPLHEEIKIVQKEEAIEIGFSEALDYLQLFDYVELVDEQGNVVEEKKIAEDGKIVTFFPEKGGNYQVKINVRLEDISANSFMGKFDQPIDETKQYQQKGFIVKDINFVK